MTSSLLREPPGVRYKVRESGPPKARLRTTSGMGMMPMTSPEGAITQMPPEPTQKTRPVVSTLRPSGTPGAADDMSQKTRLWLKLPSGATSKARIRRWVQTAPRASSSKQRSSSRLIATYRIDSSGENASPLGYSHASVARWTWPWGSIRNTPEKPMSRWAAGRRSSGSVKKNAPVRAADDIVRFIEPFAVPAVRKGRDRARRIHTCNTPMVSAFAHDETPLQVERAAIALAGLLPHHGHCAVCRVPAQQPTPGEIHKGDIPPGMPQWSFRTAPACGEQGWLHRRQDIGQGLRHGGPPSGLLVGCH